MNEFLTWKAAYVRQPISGGWIEVVIGIAVLAVLLIWVMYYFGKFIEWIVKRFFTAYDKELDEIDYYENQNRKELLKK